MKIFKTFYDSLRAITSMDRYGLKMHPSTMRFVKNVVHEGSLEGRRITAVSLTVNSMVTIGVAGATTFYMNSQDKEEKLDAAIDRSSKLEVHLATTEERLYQMTNMVKFTQDKLDAELGMTIAQRIVALFKRTPSRLE